ncbi:MAG: glycine cleavage system protein R [Chromatiales bacterium]
MATSLVLTAIGVDRPGLVEALSRTVAAHGGNWLESRMSRLASRFAGILLVSVPGANAEALKGALLALESEGLRIAVEESAPDTTVITYRTVKLELMGQDRAGIIHEISEALAKHRVSIDELVTEVQSASWSGETLCQVHAELRVPRDVSTAALREVLEDIANEFMVDITLDDLPTS